MGYMRHMRYMECEGSRNRDVQFYTTHLDESMEHDYSWCLTKVTKGGGHVGCIPASPLSTRINALSVCPMCGIEPPAELITTLDCGPHSPDRPCQIVTLSATLDLAPDIHYPYR